MSVQQNSEVHEDRETKILNEQMVYIKETMGDISPEESASMINHLNRRYDDLICVLRLACKNIKKQKL
jgi:hypothetical protein